MEHAYETLLAEANELRASAFKLSSSGLHALADQKMQELQDLVRAADGDAAERARREKNGGR